MKRRQFVKTASAFAAGGLLAAPMVSRARADADEAVDAVIVGGGASGLAAAWMLQEYDIRVLEAEPVLGGRTIGGTWNGFSYPKGTEYVGEPEGPLAAWIDDLGLEPVPVPPPTGAVARNGRIWSGRDILGFLPDEKALEDYARLAELLEDLNDTGLGDAAFEGPEAMARFAKWDRISVGQWLAQEEIHPAVRALVDVENRGLFGAANADLSFAWNVPEMAWNLYDPDAAYDSGVYTFPHGLEEIIATAGQGLGPSVIRTGAWVEGVAADGGGEHPIHVTYADATGRHALRARACILTVPAPVAAAMAADCLPSETRRALASVGYAPYVTVNLMLKRRVLYESWSVAALGEVFATLYDAVRLQVPADYDGPAVLGVYVPPAQAADRSLLALPDGAIVDQVLDGLAAYVPDIRELVVAFDLQRFDHAFPVFGPGYTDVLAVLKRDGGNDVPVFLAGDYMVYATFDGAVQSAVEAVDRLERYF